MNWDEIQGRWQEFTGDVKSKWAKLTNDDLTLVGGKKDKLIGVIQQRYGYLKEEAEKAVDDWLNNFVPPQHTKDKPA